MVSFLLLLVIFTASYPYDFASEQTFLARELVHLARSFDKVVLAPRVVSGTLLPIPPVVDVEDGYAVAYRRQAQGLPLLFRAFRSQSFYQELYRQNIRLLHPLKLLRLILAAGRAEITREWFEKWMLAREETDDQVVAYSYWFDDTVSGLGLVKAKHAELVFVTRAHGYDIYEELYVPYYWPLRQETLARLDKLFAASHDGQDYFRRRYAGLTNLFETAHLGIEDPGFVSQPSKDGIFRIVSCAHIVPLKRLDLLLEGIALTARMRPEQKFEWRHFGEGKARTKLQSRLDTEFPPNATGTLPGFVPNPEILQYYRDNPVDVFVNLSTTEGGAPVSIMEAISCGIPVVATRVGGNPEIVSEKNGILLDADPTPEQVARALLTIWDNPKTARLMRVESRRIWQESYNADVNFKDFAERLKSLVKSK